MYSWFVEKMIKNILSRFASDIDQEWLKIQSSVNQYTFENLSLKANAFNSFGLPFTLAESKLERLQIGVQLKPVLIQVELNNILLVFEEKARTNEERFTEALKTMEAFMNQNKKTIKKRLTEFFL